MPTYEYVCDACGHRFERFQGISEPPVKVCPECGKRKVRRLISSGAGLVFKGPGFYATDYRKSPAGKEGEAGKEASREGGKERKREGEKGEKKKGEAGAASGGGSGGGGGSSNGGSGASGGESRSSGGAE